MVTGLNEPVNTSTKRLIGVATKIEIQSFQYVFTPQFCNNSIFFKISL